MSIFDNFYINKYKKLLNQIEKLNIKNVKGYKTFFEYVLADQEMINYFKQLKDLEKKCNKIHVDSYETFENNIFKQLKQIYEKKLYEIMEEENYDDKLSKLLKFKEELNKCFGYGSDKAIKKIIDDIEEKIKFTNNYIINDSNKNEKTYEKMYNVEILEQIERANEPIEEEADELDPFLMEAIDYVVETGQASTSFIQRIFKVGYARAGRIIDQMEERGIISEYEGSKPRTVLMSKERWQKLKKSDTNILKSNNKKNPTNSTYIQYENYKNSDSMSDEDIMKMYGIDVEYNSKFNTLTNLYNSLIIENTLDNDKLDFINNLLKYNTPQQLRMILINCNNPCFNFYNVIPHTLIPVVTDINKIEGVFIWILQEINNRLNLFLQEKVKDINTYNEKVKDEILPEIVIIIDEIYEIFKKDEIREILLKMLLNGERAGIKCIFYSKFSKRNLNIGSMEDLLHIYTKYSPHITTNPSIEKQAEIERIDYDMDGFDFEKYAGELLHNNGFERIEVTQQSGDFGVDIIAYKDDIKYSIQCKKYSSPVGIKAVQEVIGSKTMNNCHVAVVLSNNYFTNSAKELAKKNNVLLWDRDKLIDLINNAKSRRN
jgi:hypothetical protein